MDSSQTRAPDQRPPRPDAVGRLWGLDQARAVAFIAMILAHFAPGVFERVPSLASLHDPVRWFGRLATPAFMVIFGVTAGFVFLPRYVRGTPGDTGRKLVRRAAIVFVCAIAIVIPEWIRFACLPERPGGWDWVFEVYSVLVFYTIGLAVLPLWLRLLSRQTLIRAIVCGVALWLIGIEGYRSWEGHERSLPEFIRMLLVSGPYAYFQMMGTALVAMPLGLYLRRALQSGRGDRVLVGYLLLGLAVSAAGAVWGFSRGEIDPVKIINGELRIPPRAWYFLHFGGIALAMIPILEFATRPWLLRSAGYALALFGQTSLLLFTGHAFVLPLLKLTDTVGTLHGPWRVSIPFAAFAAFCGIVMYVRHRQNERKRTGVGA